MEIDNLFQHLARAELLPVPTAALLVTLRTVLASVNRALLMGTMVVMSV